MLNLCVILNAPPGAGKDTIADLLVAGHGFKKFQMKTELNKAVAYHYGISLAEFEEMAGDRDLKEIPVDFLDGKSPREAQIHVSEDLIKPKHGKDYFGRMAALACSDSKVAKAVFSDGGFEEEIRPLIQVFEKVAIVRLRREGYTFENDSRNYLESLAQTYDITLIEGDPLEALDEILKRVGDLCAI